MRRVIISTALRKLFETCHSESVVCSRNLVSSLDGGKSRFLASLGMTGRRVLRLATQSTLTLGFAMGLAGCGYHTAGHFSTMPKNVHVIAVPAMENKTSTYRVEQKLTAATIHELLVKTNYRVVSDASGGDAVLTGKVLRMEVVPLLFQTTSTATTSTAQATAMLVTMTCDVTLTDRATEKVLYHNENFLFRNEYQLSTDVRNFFQEGDPALDRMAQDFAARLVAAVTENF
jgi:outer membrane lipopolysaccharide assembly protein LptE/RlpB